MSRSIKITILLLIFSCTAFFNANAQSYNYKPDNQKLYETIVHLDSTFFDLYNSCKINLDKYADFFSDSLEFYHDKGGLMTSKDEMIAATKKNVCGYVTRELVKGSIEVYPIKDYGAVEIGLHKFHNSREKEISPAAIGRFVIVWQFKNDKWKITRVISLH